VTYDGLNSYLYDAEGRICAVKNSVGSLTGYIYDAAGIRVAKGSLTSFSCNFASNGFAVNTSWALGQGGEQVAEFSVSGSASTWKHSNAYAGKLLGTYDAKGLHFYLDDWLGTRRIQTNALGQLELTCQSLPYGNGENCIATALSTAEDPTEQHFTGKERDAESGNDYFEARYYSSAAGRFLSPDWSAKEEPVPYAKLDDPQTLNLYDYVRNNPMTGVDADGHDGWDILVGTANAVKSNLSFGLGREESGNADFKMGQKIGDAISMAGGLLEMAHGSSLTVGGLALCSTGAGCLAGAPAAAAGLAEAAHGISTAGNGLKNFLKKDEAKASEAGSSDGTNSGKAPKGDDGHPMELHHDSQNPNGELKEMTRTEHRLGDNFKKNHANTGQEASKIDRAAFKKQREQYWKDKK